MSDEKPMADHPFVQSQYHNWGCGVTLVNKYERTLCKLPRSAHPAPKVEEDAVTLAMPSACPACGAGLNVKVVGVPGDPDTTGGAVSLIAEPAPPPPKDRLGEMAEKLAGECTGLHACALGPPPHEVVGEYYNEPPASPEECARCCSEARIRSAFEALIREERQRIGEFVREMAAIVRPKLDFHDPCCEQTLREVLRRLEEPHAD